MRIVRLSPFPADLLCGSLQASLRYPGSRAWSFQTCMGSATTQVRPGARDDAPDRIAFRFDDSVGDPITVFRSSIPSPSVPLFTLHRTSRDVPCKTRGRVVRYSFLVRILHPLLHAGLSRRTVNYFCPSATTISPHRVDSSLLLPSAARCLMKNVTRPSERGGWQIEEATERDNEAGTD
jgi:hypothetical protein